jgi:hypothetical protein
LAINEQISARIQSFTAELEALVRAAALESVRQALGGAPAPRAAVGRPAGRPAAAPRAAPPRAAAPRAAAPRAAVPRAAAPQAKAAAPAAAAPKARARAGRKSAGGKRPPAQLAALVTRTGEWIKANPGHGVEDMAKALNVRTKELALPIQKLLGARTIKKRGQKRATKYFGS